MTERAAPGAIQALTSTNKHSPDRFSPSPAAFDPTFPSDDAAAAANDSLSGYAIERLADSY